ncbi:hypothetical protein ACFLS1_00295 [Verrucomicrobiota bacterium]
MSIDEKQLLFTLQKGIPIELMPFQSIAKELGSNGTDILAFIKDLFDSGKARRFGGVFDSNMFGFFSTLCAVAVPEEAMTRVVEILSPHPGITHLYEREATPNIWFTLTAPSELFEKELTEFSEKLKPFELFSLPVVRKFKIQVVFDTTGNEENVQPFVSETRKSDTGLSIEKLTKQEKDILKYLQGNIPLSERPFRDLADKLGLPSEELINTLKHWKDIAVLRRIGIILRHRQIGFTANGMCAWNVESEKVEAAGKKIASFPQVTHCYERIPPSIFPYNLFAMIHADSKEKAEEMMREIENSAGLSGGRILFSVKEFKKSSMLFVQDNQ